MAEIQIRCRMDDQIKRNGKSFSAEREAAEAKLVQIADFLNLLKLDLSGCATNSEQIRYRALFSQFEALEAQTRKLSMNLRGQTL